MLGQKFLENYGSRALILGGSEGIGASFADQLASLGFDLTLIARNVARLDDAARKLRGKHGIEVDTQAIDLTSPDAGERLAGIIASHEYGLVVYNAGATHGGSLFLDQPLQNSLDLVALNCVGPITVAYHALGPMRERGRGGLILLSSMSALVGTGYVAAYSATKSFDLVFAEGLHWEMARSGVDVLCVIASLTDTPAMVRSGLLLDAMPEYVAMDPADVAQGGLAALGKQPLWFAAGSTAAKALADLPRETASDQMSRASAMLYGISV